MGGAGTRKHHTQSRTHTQKKKKKKKKRREQHCRSAANSAAAPSMHTAVANRGGDGCGEGRRLCRALGLRVYDRAYHEPAAARGAP